MKLDLARLAVSLLLVICMLGWVALVIALTILTKWWFLMIAFVIGVVWFVYAQLDDF